MTRRVALSVVLALLSLVALGWTLRRNLQLHILGRKLDALGWSGAAIAASCAIASAAIVTRRLRR